MVVFLEVVLSEDLFALQQPQGSEKFHFPLTCTKMLRSSISQSSAESFSHFSLSEKVGHAVRKHSTTIAHNTYCVHGLLTVPLIFTVEFSVNNSKYSMFAIIQITTEDSKIYLHKTALTACFKMRYL